MKIPHTPGASMRLIILIILLVLLPVVFFSAYQIGTYSSSEETMRDLYRRQLDVMLYSLNQYSWDATAHWVAALQAEMMDAGRPMEARLQHFLEKAQVVEAVLTADSAGHDVRITTRPEMQLPPSVQESLAVGLHALDEQLHQLVRYRTLDYRKTESVVLTDPRTGVQRIALIAASDPASPLPRFAGVIFQAEEFITKMLAGRIQEAAGQEFVIAVLRKGQSTPIVVSGTLEGNRIVERRDLWTFPDHEIAIGSLGTTLDDVVHGRLVRNTVLVVVLNLFLFVGVFMIYRNVRGQIELARAKSTFVSNVSHELRTPLALIRMFAETLEMGRLKDEAKKQEYYKTILRETERLTHLVNNLLNFSRMEAGRKPYQLAPCSLSEIVRSVVSTYMPHLEHAGFAPLIELPEDACMITADKEALAEAIINLLDNAVKYSGEQKFLRVHVERTVADVRVKVEDHGIGIAPQYHEKIFEAFFRVPSGFVHDTKGSGLGLSLVKHIMHAHGGRIELESKLEKGTAVRLVFPLTQV
jgi:two-component system, OmpR family, phosphate regulon sensor histidine kinase PhoR